MRSAGKGWNVKYIAASVFLLIIGSLIWNTDWFQRTCFPGEYWNKKADSAIEMITESRRNARRASLSVAELTRTKDIYLDKAKLDGLTQQEAIDEYTEDIKIAKESSAEMRRWLKDDLKELSKINAKLKRLGLPKKSFNESALLPTGLPAEWESMDESYSSVPAPAPAPVPAPAPAPAPNDPFADIFNRK